MVSPAFDWHESRAKVLAGRATPISESPGAKVRADSIGCLRLARASLTTRKGARTGVVFCSGRTVREKTAFGPPNKLASEGDKPICCAPQTVNVAVKATANPVHLLLRSSVALGFAKCTSGASACPMPRVYGVKPTPFASEKMDFRGMLRGRLVPSRYNMALFVIWRRPYRICSYI